MRRRASDRSPLLDSWIDRVLRKDSQFSGLAGTPGVVVSVRASTALVSTAEGEAAADPGFRPLAVGDQVEVADGEVIRLLPRRSLLSRPDPGKPGGRLLIAANIDLAIVVVSVVEPPLHPRIIDRYLMAIHEAGAEALICVNKVDLLPADSTELEALEPYRSRGVAVLSVSASAGLGLEELRAAAAGKTIVFVGHSGVGKSSLANRFAELNLKTGKVWKGYGRGAHTTSVSSLHQLEDGTRLIDTPGVRAFGIEGLGEDALAAAFPEFTDPRCRFRDCSHRREPGCEILAKLADGTLDQDRYELFLRLREEAG